MRAAVVSIATRREVLDYCDSTICEDEPPLGARESEPLVTNTSNEINTHARETPAPSGLLIPRADALMFALASVIPTFPSKHTRKLYTRHFREFLDSPFPFTRSGIEDYIEAWRKRTEFGNGATSMRLCINALKTLSRRLYERDYLAPDDYAKIQLIRLIKRTRARTGIWLNLSVAQDLIDLPERSTLIGKRDAAIMALLLGAGLRREEATNLKWNQFQDRDERACLVDIEGKGQKLRTVPIPSWAQRDLEAWRAEIKRSIGCTEAILERSYALRRVREANGILSRSRDRLDDPDMPRLPYKPRHLIDERMTTDGVWFVMAKYAKKLGVEFTPHDLRRTLAKLMRKKGVALEQIQYQLGHSSVKTTELYLGGAIELKQGRAGVDRTGIDREIEIEIEEGGDDANDTNDDEMEFDD